MSEMKKNIKKHDFLSEELLIPGVNMSDTMRINMFDNHLLQSIVLAETEFPKVFTNFENQIGDISSAKKIATSDLKILERLFINKFKNVVILKDKENKIIDIFKRQECFWLTEYYGWKNNNYIDEFEVGETFPKGECLFSNTSYDEDMNFGYGVNLNAMFFPYKNLTYEDAIVINESTAKKMSSYNIHVVEVTVNSNDILLNLYGNSKKYKSFPNIGEEINNKILCARRRISHNSALAELKNDNINKINYNTDTIFYSNGKVIDIEIFSNQPLEELERHKIFKYEVSILKNYYRYCKKFIELIDKYEKKYPNYTFSDDLNFEYNRCQLALDEEKKWLSENKEFNYLIYRFIIIEINPLVVGNKITNRYGGKGVISKILPDEEMPVNQYGERPDIILNVLGVINRTNLSQLLELEINFISKEIERYLSTIDDIDKKKKILFKYLKICNKNQYKFTKEYYENLPNDNYRNCFWDEICSEGIYIHQPPFYKTMNIDTLMELYTAFPFIKPYKFENIQNELIMGKIYYMRLKHDSFGKFSARSAKYLNLKKVPAKSRSFKNSENLYSSTPIRLGEMEIANLIGLNNIDELIRFIELYSSNNQSRRSIIIQLLLATNPLIINEIKNNPTEKGNIRKILDEYLMCLGIELENEKKE